MPIDGYEDPGQQFAFHLVDISDWPGIPVIQDALFVDASFTDIGAVEYTLDQEDFKPLNEPKKSFTVGESVGGISLGRGLVRKTSDFFSWLMHHVLGDRKMLGGGYRKNFMLFALNPGARVSRIYLHENQYPWTANPGGFFPGQEVEIVKAWSLFDCKPGVVQMAGGFNALSSDVVTTRLDIIPETIDEWGPGLGGIVGAAVDFFT